MRWMSRPSEILRPSGMPHPNGMSHPSGISQPNEIYCALKKSPSTESQRCLSASEDARARRALPSPRSKRRPNSSLSKLWGGVGEG